MVGSLVDRCESCRLVIFSHDCSDIVVILIVVVLIVVILIVVIVIVM